jgi:serine/threonine protein kinase
MDACPPDDLLDALLADEVADAARREALEAHLGACEACGRRLLERAGGPEVGPGVAVGVEAGAGAESADDAPSRGFLDAMRRLVLAEAPAWGDAPAPPMIDGIEVLEEIGRGGMGVVYRARQTGLNRIVALKLLPKPLPGFAPDRSGVRRGPEALARLDHPNIVRIYRVGEAPGFYYGVLEYLGGGRLADRIVDGRPGSPRWAGSLVRTLAGAVGCMHEHRIVHRDLKPANILFSAEGVPKIADFGIARLLDDEDDEGGDPSRPGELDLVGSPAYMAPEQAWGRASAVGPAADLHALGAILFELLTGRPPFGRGPRERVLRAVRHDPPPPLGPGVPPALAAACRRCLAKEPADRFAGARDLADALAAAIPDA